MSGDASDKFFECRRGEAKFLHTWCLPESAEDLRGAYVSIDLLCDVADARDDFVFVGQPSTASSSRTTSVAMSTTLMSD